MNKEQMKIVLTLMTQLKPFAEKLSFKDIDTGDAGIMRAINCTQSDAFLANIYHSLQQIKRIEDKK